MNPEILPFDDHHDVLIVIPTVATPSVLVPAFILLLNRLDGMRAHIVLSVNPVDNDAAAESITACERVWSNHREHGQLDGSMLTIYRHPGPAGFGGAINLGLEAAINSTGVPPMTVIFNDDLRVTNGWLKGMRAAMDTEEIELWSEPPLEPGGTRRPKRSAGEYGRIGIVGPMTNQCAGIQKISDEHGQHYEEMGAEAFAEAWRDSRFGQVISATFLSGFCAAFRYECLCDLAVMDGDDRLLYLFDERYKIAGYEDNDICFRAELAGWRLAVAADTFIGHIGHQTFDGLFPEATRGLRNQCTYYDVWRPQIQARGRKLVAVYRVKIDVPHDLHLMRSSLVSISRVVDGVAVLLTNNPMEAGLHPEAAEDAKAGKLHPSDGNLIKLCHDEPNKVSRHFREWCQKWLAASQHARQGIEVQVHRWSGAFNERDERNRAIGIAYSMDADWVLSIDHDELIENRIGRPHFDRLMSHPDPAVWSYDFAFLNHWDSNRLINRTPPWGDGGAYLDGMRGYRMFKANKEAPRYIQAGNEVGLHCGNTPDFDLMAKRVAGCRFRHLGYMRPQDRWRKEARYNKQDPNPDPLLIGGTTYAHISHEEHMVMDAYAPCNGIGLHMLLYEGEIPENLGRWLNDMYALVDRIVLVWTGAWAPDTMWDDAALYTSGAADDGDPRHTMRPRVDLWSDGIEDVWPDTGPSLIMARLAEHFGCEWIHQPLNDNLAAARNEAIDALQETPDIGWGIFVDPDEYMPEPYRNIVALRRMAECTDAWGWIIPFVNMLPDGGHNESEAVRMHRIDEGRIMRMNGRVHETFADAQLHLRESGMTRILRPAPIHMINLGLSGDADAMDDKLERYHRMTVLDLEDNPYSAHAWTTLGLHWLNQGCPVVGQECLNRAIACSRGAYLPFHALALHYLRLGKGLLRESVDRMGNHRNRKLNQKLLDVLDSGVPALPVMGSGPAGQVVSEEEALASLPAFPWPPPGLDGNDDDDEDGFYPSTESESTSASTPTK